MNKSGSDYKQASTDASFHDSIFKQDNLTTQSKTVTKNPSVIKNPSTTEEAGGNSHASSQVKSDNRPKSQSIAPSKAENQGRLQHLIERQKHNQNKHGFLLRGISFCVGFGNMFSISKKVFSHGIYYIVAYLVMIVIIGIPSVYLEACLGQFTSSGPVGIWSFSGLFYSAGVAIQLIQLYTVVYYGQFCGYLLYYLGSSLASKPYWSVQDDEEEEDNVNVSKSGNGSCLVGHSFYQKTFEDVGFNYAPFLLALFTLFITALFFTKVKSNKNKTVYILAVLGALILLAYVIILSMLIRSVVSQNIDVVKSIRRSLNKKSFFSSKLWVEATHGVFFDLFAQGCFATIAMNNNFHDVIFGNIVAIAAVEYISGIIPGVILLVYIGGLSEKCPDGYVDNLVNSVTKLAFEIYPSAISQLPNAAFWGSLFFLTLFIMAFTSYLVFVESIALALKDIFPRLQKHFLIVCAVLFCLTVPFNTDPGLNVFTSTALTSLNSLLFQAVTFVVLSWVYGADNFLNDIEFMRGKEKVMYCIPWKFVRLYLMIIWKYVSPPLLMLIVFYDFARDRFSQRDSNDSLYAFKLVVLFIPITAFCVIFVAILARAEGPFLQRLRSTLKPTPLWGPASLAKRREYSNWLKGHRKGQSLAVDPHNIFSDPSQMLATNKNIETTTEDVTIQASVNQFSALGNNADSSQVTIATQG